MKARYLLSIAILGVLPFAATPASAGIAGMTQAAIANIENPHLVQVQRRVYRGPSRTVVVNRGVNRAVVRGPRVNRAVVVAPGRGLYRGRYVYRGGPWVRPRNYWWPIGGAVAAGAALGMVAASSATWAGPAPGPGYCWYYTDPSRRQGFWDQCP